MKLPKISVDNYQFTIIVFVLIVIAGISSYLNMPRTENPEMTVPGGTVIAIYPGASPIDIEQLIATPLEDAINEIEDIKKIETNLNDGICAMNVEFMFGTDAGEKYDELVQKVNEVRPTLPDDIFYMNTSQWKSSDVAMLQIAITSDSAEYYELENIAEELKRRLNKIRDIRKIDYQGFPNREVRISLDMEKMAVLNLSVTQVAQAIMSNNTNIPGGNIDLGMKSFSIKTSGTYQNIDELKNTVVHSNEGNLIYLKNIAHVGFDYEDEKYLARFNSERCIFVTVKQKEGLNIFKIMDKVKPVISDFESNLDQGISLNYVFDQSVEVDNKINGFLSNLLQGVVLVGLVIFLALGFKSAIIVMLAIPISIIMGLHFVDLVGYGLEQISIAGLVVALGLLVDNNIVMIENINRYLEMGYKPRKAAVKAASEVGWPIVSATATTVLAFIPIITMPDKAGDFIRSMPTTIIATLVYSLLIALTLTPLIASKTYKAQDIKKETKVNFAHRFLNRLIAGPYRKTLNFALKRKMLISLIALATLFVSLFMAKYIGISFFPKAEKPQFMIRIQLPKGSSLEKTDSTTRYVESVLDTIDEVSFYATNVGHGNPRIYYNVMEKTYTRHFAEIFVQISSYDPEQFDRFITNLRSFFGVYPDAQINILEFEQGVPVAAPIMVYIHGENFEILKKISKEVEEKLKAQPGVININNELARDKTDIRVKINKDKASMYGVPVVEIDKTIRAAINGMTFSKYKDKEGKEYDIVLRLPTENGLTIHDFDKIYVQSLSKKLIPLKQLASIEFTNAHSLITRYNLERSALITGNLKKGASLDNVLDPVISMLKSYPFPHGYSYHVGGELENRSETFGGMVTAILIAAIAIFAVLVLQFKSFSQPVIIFVAIPFALIGMIWALLITHNTFSFSAFIGLIALVGIVINNSIILVDFANQLVKEGKPVYEAIKFAGETRFTPIILTSLTTIGGLLPLTLQGGSMWAPMGWTIIGGLFASTFLTLIMVPVLYAGLSRLKQSA